jgi:ribonuclease PH
MSRPGDRKPNALRHVEITPHFQRYPEGSALIKMGQTQVICAATLAPGVPRWRKDSGHGWITAEYGMLPRSTQERTEREAVRGKVSGRTSEIMRLIGRSLRVVIELSEIGEFTVTIDCDVVEADGGTRTASITGASVALWIALERMRRRLRLAAHPMREHVCAVSVGIVEGVPSIDLEYSEDVEADVDMNVVLTAGGKFVEIQGTAEGAAFDDPQLQAMLALAKGGAKILTDLQVKACKAAAAEMKD